MIACIPLRNVQYLTYFALIKDTYHNLIHLDEANLFGTAD